ncbi:MAG: hypothetical protein HYV36_03680 [Lentisphaerae bacterium]|nr:hypothetical protein [Lentisphaerota bacterium]
MQFQRQVTMAALATLIISAATAQTVSNDQTLAEPGQAYRLYEGITVYINNPEGKDFTVSIDVRDLNLRANGPREMLLKLYDPDGQPVVREIIPDDGCVTPNFPDRIGGWDHELQYYANLYAKGTFPSFRWSAWSDPARLNTLVKRAFARPIKGGKKGSYRLVLAGTPDHYVSLSINPELKTAVGGHPNFLHGHGDQHKKSFIYVPKGTVGLFFAAVEPDPPRTRRFKITAPDGKVLLETEAKGGYVATIDDSWQGASLNFAKPGEYDGKLLTLEVAPGEGDYLVRLMLQQPQAGAFKDYVGMGSSALLAPDAATALALKGGTLEADGLVFWHPFQVRFHNWLKANKLEATDQEKALRKELEAEFNGLRLLETSDGRGVLSWANWAYAMGYYGCKIFQNGWRLMQRADVPAEAKALIKEGLIMAGDRLSFAAGGETVNGNAFAQINVALWYSHRATGDALQKERFETFWQRWTTEGWGRGAGLSRSGDAQEHFAHDCHYGSYLMDNWKATGNQWIATGGILGDATDDPRFQKVLDRYQELYSYLFCREVNQRAVAANPWSARTAMSPHSEANNWESAKHRWKGEPGPDFTVSVNGGDEWFAARRKNYYLLTFHGRLAPEWLGRSFYGQVGFGGGIICQLTVPGKGPVLASTLHDSYGKGMDPSNMRKFHVHSLVGELWDSLPLISAISEHDNAKLNGNTVTSSGEVRDGHVKVTRSYTYNADSIDCAVSLAESDYARVLSIWAPGREWSGIRLAYEMIPYLPKDPANKKATMVTLFDETAKDLGAAAATPVLAKSIRIDRGGFGVNIQLDQPRKVLLGSNDTVLIQLVEPGEKPTPADKVALTYRLAPFGG